jgi:hypothetical protein
LDAKALFRGPVHVCVKIDDEMRAAKGDIVGIPAGEAFLGDEAATMDAVFADGRVRMLSTSLATAPATMMVAPIIRDAMVWGVVASWTRVAAS